VYNCFDLVTVFMKLQNMATNLEPLHPYSHHPQNIMYFDNVTYVFCNLVNLMARQVLWLLVYYTLINN
jgi:hypothetical protein